jgi:hypothetical protein
MWLVAREQISQLFTHARLKRHERRLLEMGIQKMSEMKALPLEAARGGDLLLPPGVLGADEVERCAGWKGECADLRIAERLAAEPRGATERLDVCHCVWVRETMGG